MGIDSAPHRMLEAADVNTIVVHRPAGQTCDPFMFRLTGPACDLSILQRAGEGEIRNTA
jgi:hypothetical protein